MTKHQLDNTVRDIIKTHYFNINDRRERYLILQELRHQLPSLMISVQSFGDNMTIDIPTFYWEVSTKGIKFDDV